MPPFVSPAAADCRFADVAAAYLERHIRRYLVPVVSEYSIDKFAEEIRPGSGPEP